MATSMSVDLTGDDDGGVSFGDLVHLNKTSLWDPELSSDWDVKPTEQCFLRIKRDIMSIYKDPTPGMCIVPDKEDMTKLHALINGPFDTPYEGGFFYFVIRFPPDYPIKPPRVKLITTGGGTVRFNPNLYKNGKVCLSILGTWSGPGWSPANSIASVLISIQSLMNEKPYHNEPGFEKERQSGDAKRYNDIIRHETLRVAVCDMLESDSPCPEALREVIESSFGNYYDYYISVCQNNMHINTQPMQDPFGEKRGVFNYKLLLQKLEKLKEKYSVIESDSASDLDTASASESGDDNAEDSAGGLNTNKSTSSCSASLSKSVKSDTQSEKSNSGKVNNQGPSCSSMSGNVKNPKYCEPTTSKCHIKVNGAELLVTKKDAKDYNSSNVIPNSELCVDICSDHTIEQKDESGKPGDLEHQFSECAECPNQYNAESHSYSATSGDGNTSQGQSDDFDTNYNYLNWTHTIL